MTKRPCRLGTTHYYGWIGRSPEKLQELLTRAVDLFEHSVGTLPDAIAFTGSSGAAIAFPLALRYKLPLIYIRKAGEKSHGGYIECNYSGHIKNYMIVDDFMATGRTLRRIKIQVKRACRELGVEEPQCLGTYLYQDEGDYPYTRMVDRHNTITIYPPRPKEQ